MKKKLECSEKKKLTNTCEYWKWTPSNKLKQKKKLKKRISQENEKTS